MNFEQWLEANRLYIEEETFDLMKEAYIGGLKTAHDLLDNAEPKDFHWCRHIIENLIEENDDDRS